MLAAEQCFECGVAKLSAGLVAGPSSPAGWGSPSQF